MSIIIIVTLQAEFEESLDFVPKPDVLQRRVVRSLVRQGRPPFLIAHDGEKKMEAAICFIPAGQSEPPKTFKVSIENARRIALIRDELQRLT